jgi:hypothetical protein
MSGFIKSQDQAVLKREITQNANHLEIVYTFLNDTIDGFFLIEENFKGEVKMWTDKSDLNFLFKNNSLRVAGTAIHSKGPFIFIVEGKGIVEVSSMARFENYPYNQIKNEFSSQIFDLTSKDILAFVPEKNEKVIAKEENSNVKSIESQPNADHPPGKKEKGFEKNEKKEGEANPLSLAKNVNNPEVPALVARNRIEPSKEGVRFRIQLAASATKMDMGRLTKLTGLDVDVYEDIIDNLYKYTIGNEIDMAQAQVLLNKLAVNNFKKPFIVAYKDGKRISIQQARAEIIVKS